MLPQIARPVVVVVAFLVVGAPVARSQDAPLAPPNQGILVLRNGQFIEGRISQAEGLYLVDLPDGQIRVKPADVDVVAKSLEEGYAQKRAAIQVGNVHSHLELAQWCLRHNLLGPATAEVADATAADPNNPLVGAMQRRLKMALEPPATADPASQVSAGPSNDELDRMIRGLPHGAVEAFTQTVQPVLINHCATSGCHGPQSETGLRLLRSSGGKTAGRRITQRNLYSALQFVDRENPMASKLLTAASGPHGTARYAIFSERQTAQYRHLVEWANQLAGVPASELATAAASVAAVPASALPESAPQALSPEARRGRPLAAGEKAMAARHNAARPAAKTVGEAAPASYNQPADPFDPEVFNRQFAPKEKQPADAKLLSPQ